METATLQQQPDASIASDASTTAAVETQVVVKKAKATKKASKKPASKTAKPVVKKEEVKKIDVKVLVIHKDAEMKVMGTCVKFTGKNGHGYLKGRTLEISNPDIAELKNRQENITKAEAEKYHLGKSKAFIRKIESTEDLQKILDIYLG